MKRLSAIMHEAQVENSVISTQLLSQISPAFLFKENKVAIDVAKADSKYCEDTPLYRKLEAVSDWLLSLEGMDLELFGEIDNAITDVVAEPESWINKKKLLGLIAEALKKNWSSNKKSEINAEHEFQLFKNAYAKIGSLFQNAEDLRSKYDLFIQGKPGANGLPTAFTAFSETRYGYKFGVLGQDGSKEGLAFARETIGRLKSVPGIYGEVSEAPLAILYKESAPPIVSFENAKKVLGGRTEIRRPTADELNEAIKTREIPDKPEARANCYIRSMVINGFKKNIVKVMVGNPILDGDEKKKLSPDEFFSIQLDLMIGGPESRWPKKIAFLKMPLLDDIDRWCYIAAQFIFGEQYSYHASLV
jgi:hypothetical protein